MGICLTYPQECCDANNGFTVYESCKTLLPTPTTTILNGTSYFTTMSPTATPTLSLQDIANMNNQQKAWWTYHYVTVPLQITKISGSISIAACILVILTFIPILIYQPVM
jgi:hypothetical protein